MPSASRATSVDNEEIRTETVTSVSAQASVQWKGSVFESEELRQGGLERQAVQTMKMRG